MPGKIIQLSELAARKQLLVLESDLNRLLLMEDVTVVRNEAKKIATRIASTGPLTALAVQVGSSVTGLFGRLFHRSQAGEPAKPSKFSSLLRSLRAGVMLWSALRAHRR